MKKNGSETMSKLKKTITVNGNKYEFEPGETILEVARRNEIYIPTLCHLKGAPPTGACRICIVDVKGAPGPIAACSSPAADNMEVSTETPRIVKARKMVLELLLISGNHNCSVRGNFPEEWSDFQQEVSEYDRADDICVAYGRCELQALAYRYQVTRRTLDRIPTKYPLEYNDPLIGRDFGRCILCGRCVQACCEIQVNNAISHGYRGNIAKIVVRGDKTLPDSDCVYCGECVQSCPVGALFEKRNRFNSRMWDVTRVKTTCYYCGVGCQLDLCIKDNEIVKVDGIEDAKPNLGRLCFKGRFGFDFIHSNDRLLRPKIRENGKLVESNWEKALDLVARKMTGIKEKYGSEAIGCFVSTKNTNEDLFLTKKFFNQIMTSENIFHFEPPSFMGIDYQEIKKAETIVVAGTDIVRDNPVAATFIKQAVLQGTRLIVVDSENMEIAKFAHLQLKNLSGLEKEIKGETLVFHDPRMDISDIKKIENLRICSISRENNTVGAYIMGIFPKRKSELNKVKFLYSMTPHMINTDSLEFLVVQDIFPTEIQEKADIVLPASVWVEYDGSTISSDYRINRIRKAVDSPGEAKPTWWIFRELAKKLGHNWEMNTAEDIWEKEIA
ncbi:MAG: molybdopterin-dependent oxidoreductase, partial [Candidatus Aminicenantes bacterium]|nr:molybdopterin-dependent oxidoreductase [Candidatus Aminicenantes bacterium]